VNLARDLVLFANSPDEPWGTIHGQRMLA